MRIYDLLAVIPVNRTLSIYDKDDNLVATIGMKEMLENPD